MIWDVVGVTRQGIGFTGFLSRDLMDGEREVREELSPAGLPIRQLGRVVEDFEILMIGENFKLMRTTFEVMSPFTKSLDDGEEFLIINVVVPFSFNERLGHEGDGVPETIRTMLGENGATSIL